MSRLALGFIGLTLAVSGVLYSCNQVVDQYIVQPETVQETQQ